MLAKSENPDIKLTKKQSLVIETLANADRPLGAYSILDELRDEGFRAPLQVYRTLDQLIALGLIHRLESLNAYVACQMESCGSTNNLNASFVICDSCGIVKELPSVAVEKAVDILLDSFTFIPTKSAIEIRGICHSCQS